MRGRKRSHLGNWIRSLPAKGRSLQLEVLDEVPDSQWQFWEREYIRVFRAIGFRLVNATEGGEGNSNPSPEVRAKMGHQKNLGRKHSAEEREKIGARHRGKVTSAETKRKISVANAGKKRSPEQCAGNRFWAGKKLSEEHRGRISRANLGRRLKTNTSGFAGVSWSRAAKKWAAYLRRPGGVRQHLGHFVGLEDAVFVRALGMYKYYGT